MQHLTIRSKFTIIITAVFLIAVVAVFFVFSRVTKVVVKEFAQRVATRQALHDKYKIFSVIDRELALSLKLADDELVRAWVASGHDSEIRKKALRHLESYRRLFRDQNYFVARHSDSSYHYSDSSVSPLHTKTTVLHQDNPNDAWFYKAFRLLESFELNLNYDAMLNESKLWINVNIRDNHGQRIGIGGTGLDLSGFLNGIVNTGEAGVSVILVDRQGVIQAHQDRNLVEKNALEQDPAKKVTIFKLLDRPSEAQHLGQTLKTLASEHQKVIAFPLSLSGCDSVAAVTFMPEIGWYNIVLVDLSHTLSSNLFLPFVLASILSLLIVIVIIGFFMNRMVLTPLRCLTVASEQVSQGNYGVSLPVIQHDEIGLLTKSFNVMSATVQDHTAHLEERVKERTAELTRANQQLEASQARIMESLLYARVIQASILPDPRRLERLFSEWFELYRPSDIVGGDIYWVRESQTGQLLVAVLDCTGHGVPGAFMTMTVNAVLNHVVDTRCADDPACILRETNRLLLETLRLRQDGESMVDAGLDIGLCCIDTTKRCLSFSGAGISLYFTKDAKVMEVKGERHRVGYRGNNLVHDYQVYHLEITPETVCYMTTDGFLDEGGGPKGFGFGTARFREMLQQHRTLTLANQKAAFEQQLDTWRGSRIQRDDITVFGFRL